MQTPPANEIITSQYSKVILYTEPVSETVSVPSLVGLDVSEAVRVSINSGLNVSICGPASGKVISQSLPLGALVARGEVITLYAMVTEFED